MKPTAPIAAVASSAFMGTPPELMRVNVFGALPSCASAKSIRAETYRPELPAESTAERITAFIMAAAKAIPARSKMRVNGEMLMLPSAAVSRFGSE